MEILMKIVIDSGKCTGCKCCELICYFTRFQTFNPKKACIKVVDLDYLGFSNPVLCIQCKKPRCVYICPKKALNQTEDGIIIVDETKCDGCRICIDECIIGAINFDKDRGVPLICNFCGGDPMCVKWCHSGTLRLSSDRRTRGKKELSYTIKKAKPFLRKWGIPEDSLDWYKKFI